MAVPNTDTFSLQDVQAELGGVNDDLVECFANANANLFDSEYEGSKNSLLNFRNYGGYTRIWTSLPSSVISSACSFGRTFLKYHDGANDFPINGDKIYSNNDGAGYNINNGWLRCETPGGTVDPNVVKGNSQGKIISTSTC